MPVPSFPLTLPSNPIRFFLSSIPTPVPLSGTPSFPQSASSTSITKFQSELLLIDLLFSSLDRVTIDSCSRFWFLSIRFLLDKLPTRPTRSPLLLPPSESSAIQSFTALPPSMYYYDKDPHQFSLLPFLANLLFPLASMETDHTLDGDPPPILPNPADPHSTSQKNHLATSTEVELARSKQAVQLTPCHGKEQQLTPCRRWWRRRSWPPRRRCRARCGAWRSTSPSPGPRRGRPHQQRRRFGMGVAVGEDSVMGR